jgi:hypothetical protein
VLMRELDCHVAKPLFFGVIFHCMGDLAAASFYALTSDCVGGHGTYSGSSGYVQLDCGPWLFASFRTHSLFRLLAATQ